MEATNPAENIISKLGGLTKTAKLLSTEERRFPITTVQGWKDRGEIPQRYWLPLVNAAKEQGVSIDLSMFLQVPADAA